MVSFDQCTCGAVARKPTTLLLLRLSDVRTALLQQGDFGRCHHQHGTHDALIGKQADGSFNTAKAKIYPPGLNAILGSAMHSFAEKLVANGNNTEWPKAFAPYLEQQFLDHDVIQPDNHGGGLKQTLQHRCMRLTKCQYGTAQQMEEHDFFNHQHPPTIYIYMYF